MSRPDRTLRQLLGVLDDAEISGLSLDHQVSSITSDSRQVEPGTLFVALAGTRLDGHAYIQDACERGCLAVVVEQDVECPPGCGVVRVADSRRACGFLAGAFYGNPARDMTMIGLTGTNGKTTTAWIIETILRQSGFRPGIIGTVQYRYMDRQGREIASEAPLTTPEPVKLHSLLDRMRRAGVTHVVMEVSSHALKQQRLAGLWFEMAVFTNLSRDHLDYHGTMEEYFRAKQKLFLEHLQPDGTAVVIQDEPALGEQGGWGSRLLTILREDGFVPFGDARKGRRSLTCGFSEECVVRGGDMQQDISGSTGSFLVAGEAISIQTGLIGRHNVLNMLAAAGVGIGLGLAPGEIERGLAAVGPIPGRLERVGMPPYGVSRGKPVVFVDYAHTPDGLENVLKTLRPMVRGRLFCLIGCGGDRDRGKRAVMGRIGAEHADLIMLTSDNPRSEDPAAILAEMETGVRGSGLRRVEPEELAGMKTGARAYSVVRDRRQAIHLVCAGAGPDDVVLVAGKGHETYQETAAGKRFFDDRVEVGNSRLRWTADSITRAVAGQLVRTGRPGLLGEISTDSRTIEPGDIFLALAGENFNGHDFLDTALAKGAAGLVVSESCPHVPPDVAVIRVPDTLYALGDLAAARRRALTPGLRVIGITGSSGKTTVKELAAAIFAEYYGAGHDRRLLKTAGNFNNLIGLPLTLFRLNAGHRTAVLEMGMNRPGEIERLTEIAAPDIGCVTNVQAAHLEGLGTVEGVARAKAELFAAMPEAGLRVINFDDPHVRKLRGLYGDTCIGFAVTPAGRRLRPAVRATRISSLGEHGMRFTLQVNGRRHRFSIPATGEHNVANCAAAAAIAVAAGIDLEVIVRGLQRYGAGDKRLEIVELDCGVKVVNDSYNANPGSMAAALRTVSGFGANCRRVAVLGDMLELGPGGPEAHRRIGRLVAELEYSHLGTRGELAAEMASGAVQAGFDRDRVMQARQQEELAAWLAGLVRKKELRRGDWILLKGSRGMRMEEVLAALEQHLDQEGN